MRWPTQLFGRRHTGPPLPEGHTTLGSASSAAALAQHITGPGSGSYSGTPFLLVQRRVDAAQPAMADGELSEAERHHRGILDHSRHESSLGRR